ncbi:MAG: hypothetical protein AAB656_03165 [Patescibacteria group bacterium]
MNDSFKNIIESSKGLLILLPTDPNFDEVAAGISLYLSLMGEKETVITSPSPMLVEFNRLVGVNKISKEAGNKNLTIRFSGYPAKNIEKVSYDIEEGEFKLTVIPKPGLLSPQQNQIDVSFSGVSGDMAILIGGVDQKSFPMVDSSELASVKFAHIGLTPVKLTKDVLSFDSPASSISELVSNLIKQSGLVFDPDIATNLLAGVENGSENFTNSGVSADTFAMMAELMKAGGRRIAKTEIPNPINFPPGAIPTMKDFEFENNPDDIEAKEDVAEEDAPTSWLEPKIYKGTSVS